MGLLYFYIERMKVNDMFEEYEEQLEYVSTYNEQILEYIRDVHSEDDFIDGYEFNERYQEVERMYTNGEID